MTNFQSLIECKLTDDVGEGGRFLTCEKMVPMVPRVYDAILRDHVATHRQMASDVSSSPTCATSKNARSTSWCFTLAYFQRAIGARHALQVVVDMDWVDADCFTREEPTVVPARTFLSQLL